MGVRSDRFRKWMAVEHIGRGVELVANLIGEIDKGKLNVKGFGRPEGGRWLQN